MNSLTLTLKPEVKGRLDLFGLVPDRLCGLDLASIGTASVGCAGQTKSVDQLFDIEDGDRHRLVMRGDLRNADRIGGGMSDGVLVVENSVGHRLADQMTGGVLRIAGSVEDYACSSLRGGLVEIEGDAGDYCGGAGKNFRRGMRGGVCRVSGNVGKYAGYRLRRGTFIVRGDAQLGLGSSMIAGTIVALRAIQIPWAVGMRRGTLIMLGSATPALPVGFTDWEAVQLSFLPILLADLKRYLPGPMHQLLAGARVMRALGDRASGGRGEVLWISQPDSADTLEAGFHLAATL